MKELTQSLEKYLLAVYELNQTKKDIMVKDVADYLKIAGPSTADAIKALCQKGYVNYLPYNPISLTDKGNEAIALKLYRHNTIAEFLNKVLQIEKSQAEKNASNIEYSMTQDVLTKFVHFLDFSKQCSCKEPKWIKSCKSSLEKGTIPDKCKNCTSGCSSGGCNCQK